MDETKKLEFPLFTLRLSVFVVFLLWSIDKIIRPEHAAAVFHHFYFISELKSSVSVAIGAAQLLLSVAFVLGVKKKFTYGLVFLLHLISTAACYKQYMQPYGDINLLFFAAFPMLAASYALYVLRDEDTLWVIGPRAAEKSSKY
jgi:putative oxidoreductase